VLVTVQRATPNEPFLVIAEDSRRDFSSTDNGAPVETPPGTHSHKVQVVGARCHLGRLCDLA
jgi:hypothetical protein